MAKPANAKVTVNEYGGENAFIVEYDCPGEPGARCHVPANRGEKQKQSWQLEGDDAAPTLKPSIKCNSCGWHGHLQGGQLTSVSDSKVKL